MKALYDAISVIKNNISKDMLFGEQFSLISAKGGSVLFFSSLYSISRDNDYLKLVSDLVDDSISKIERGPSNFSLATGYAGLGWLLQYLDNQRILTFDSEYLDELDDIIFQQAEIDCSIRNHDLLYGLIGKGVYFLERLPKKKARFSLIKMVEFIDSLSLHGGENWSWWENSIDQPNSINLGLAHGCASVISFLVKVYSRGIDQARIQRILLSATPWLEQQRNPYEKDQGFFPVHAGGERARALAWCQGDLGIVKALNDVSQAIPKLEYLTELVSEILTVAAEKKLRNSEIDISKDGIVDTTFCHGSAGVLHLMNRLEKDNRRLSVDYWIDQTIKSLKSNRQHDASSTGSLFFVNETSQWAEDHGLLYGSTGIGLVLLSVLDKNLRNWDSIFLTN